MCRRSSNGLKSSKWESQGVITFKLYFILLIRDALRYLVIFVQFKKREKHRWKNATSSKNNTVP